MIRNNIKTLNYLNISNILIDKSLVLDLSPVLKTAATESLMLQALHFDNPGISSPKQVE